MVCPSSSCITKERAPCRTPGVPPVMVAEWRPEPMPSPPASQPISRTPGSSRKAWNRPIALEPPPTQATAASGRRPIRSRACSRRSEEHTSELQSRGHLVCRLLLEKKNETGWKDTFLVSPGEVVKIEIEFSQPGIFMMHCHILEHEDNGMMGQLLVR